MGITNDISNDLNNIIINRKDVEMLKRLILDYIAASFAGYEQNSKFNKAVEDLVFNCTGSGESYVFLKKRKYPVGAAAFINAVYCHGAEMDDGNKTAGGHMGAHIIPAVFSMADTIKCSNKDVLTAIAVGYECFVRLSSAVQPGIIKRGFHSTGIVGTLSCAAACAKLLHLGSVGIENAIALSTTMTGGLLSYGDSRPMIKPLNPGKAAENGCFAAMLAKEGVEGPVEALEGKNGWFNAVSETFDSEYLKGTDHLLIHDSYFKLYPSCRHTHCVIDAGISLSKKIHSLADIDNIKVYIYPSAIRLAGIKSPKNISDCRFSVYYTLAYSLINGHYGVDDLKSFKISDELIEVINKIQLIADEKMENRKMKMRGAKVAIKTKNGEVFEEIIRNPKGDPENPLSKADIINKLYECAGEQVKEESLIRIVCSIEELDIKGDYLNPVRFVCGV